MMWPRAQSNISIVLISIGLAVLLARAPAAADDDDITHDRARELMLQERIAPFETLRRQILQRFPGRIIDVELNDDDGLLVYEFTVLTAQGRVLEVKVDARTGALIEVEEDD